SGRAFRTAYRSFRPPGDVRRTDLRTPYGASTTAEFSEAPVSPLVDGRPSLQAGHLRDRRTDHPRRPARTVRPCLRPARRGGHRHRALRRPRSRDRRRDGRRAGPPAAGRPPPGLPGRAAARAGRPAPACPLHGPRRRAGGGEMTGSTPPARLAVRSLAEVRCVVALRRSSQDSSRGGSPKSGKIVSVPRKNVSSAMPPFSISMTCSAHRSKPLPDSLGLYCPNAGEPLASIVGTTREPEQPIPGPTHHLKMSSRPRSHMSYGGMDWIASSWISAVSLSMSYAWNAST